MDDEIDVAPIDPKVEGSGADNGTQVTIDHCGFDLLALAAIEGAVVDANRQVIGVGEPEVVKEDFRLRPRVVEDERGLVFFDRFQHCGDRVCRASACPRGVLLGGEHLNVRVGTGVGEENLAGVRMTGEAVRDGGRVFDRGGQADAS